MDHHEQNIQFFIDCIISIGSISTENGGIFCSIDYVLILILARNVSLL